MFFINLMIYRQKMIVLFFFCHFFLLIWSGVYQAYFLLSLRVEWDHFFSCKKCNRYTCAKHGSLCRGKVKYDADLIPSPTINANVYIFFTFFFHLYINKNNNKKIQFWGAVIVVICII
ncbi:hypothetical protein BDF21DRAFT_434177 [Thamnidium elegans]|nr:hypothetical protein BDF21DRAFT_434177 [Thamnidium elegans]